MVCTKDTGMRAMASALRICPPIWKAVRGNVAMMMSQEGFRSPLRRTGTCARILRLCLASQERKMHQKDTRKNCITVRVTGFGRAVRMALEDVFVRMDAEYQTTHRSCGIRQPFRGQKRQPATLYTYHKSVGYRRLQALRDFCCALAHTHLPHPHRVNGLTQTFLSPVSRCSRRITLRPRPPPVHTALLLERPPLARMQSQWQSILERLRARSAREIL